MCTPNTFAADLKTGRSWLPGIFWNCLIPVLSGCGINHKILPSGEQSAAIHSNEPLYFEVGFPSVSMYCMTTCPLLIYFSNVIQSFMYNLPSPCEIGMINVSPISTNDNIGESTEMIWSPTWSVICLPVVL